MKAERLKAIADNDMATYNRLIQEDLALYAKYHVDPCAGGFFPEGCSQAPGSDEDPGISYIHPPKDAHDPNGAKASGKPGPAEGFQDPPDGEQWVRNPNGPGFGWLDDQGRVWVPTGQGGLAHGGPHWDRQSPNGGYDNVYPGGKVRPGG